jgi:hypothetical protein|tara:strand:+ start:531 stop:728 length:198 start_codon:yes stop_codon:yes gene_type:complete
MQINSNDKKMADTYGEELKSDTVLEDQDMDIDEGEATTKQQRNQNSIKKANFTRPQTSILKKWFI